MSERVRLQLRDVDDVGVSQSVKKVGSVRSRSPTFGSKSYCNGITFRGVPVPFPSRIASSGLKAVMKVFRSLEMSKMNVLRSPGAQNTPVGHKKLTRWGSTVECED